LPILKTVFMCRYTWGLTFHLLLILYHKKAGIKGATLLETYRKLRAGIFDYWGYFMFTIGLRIRNGIQLPYEVKLMMKGCIL